MHENVLLKINLVSFSPSYFSAGRHTPPPGLVIYMLMMKFLYMYLYTELLPPSVLILPSSHWRVA